VKGKKEGAREVLHERQGIVTFFARGGVGIRRRVKKKNEKVTIRP